MYHPEVTYAAGAGAIQFGDSNMLGLDGNAVGEEEMLATMQALKNPAWWQNMMMPGYVHCFVLFLSAPHNNMFRSGFLGRILLLLGPTYPIRLLPLITTKPSILLPL